MTLVLGSPIDLNVDFGSAAFGLSLAVDDGSAPSTLACRPVGVLGTRYVGGRLRSAGANLALDFSVVDDGTSPACDWQQTWSGGSPSTTFNPNIGFFGMTQDGPALYSSGGMGDLVFQPGLDTSFVQLTDTYTGGVVVWSWFYGVPKGHYYSKGNAVVPGGGGPADSYTAGSIRCVGPGNGRTHGWRCEPIRRTWKHYLLPAPSGCPLSRTTTPMVRPSPFMPISTCPWAALPTRVLQTGAGEMVLAQTQVLHNS